jgi:hypothetical protein
MSIHNAWEDLPLNVTGYCSDDADMEAEGGKVSRVSLIRRWRSTYLLLSLVSRVVNVVLCGIVDNLIYRPTGS